MLRGQHLRLTTRLGEAGLLSWSEALRDSGVCSKLPPSEASRSDNLTFTGLGITKFSPFVNTTHRYRADSETGYEYLRLSSYLLAFAFDLLFWSFMSQTT